MTRLRPVEVDAFVCVRPIPGPVSVDPDVIGALPLLRTRVSDKETVFERPDDAAVIVIVGAAATVMVTVAVSLPPLPSLTL